MGIDEQRREAVGRLRALTLEGGSHEMLSAIARAVMPDAGAWTVGACRGLRDRLVALIGRGDEWARGMSITEKLREYAKDWDWVNISAEDAQERLEDIADYIDAEHEKAMAAAALIAGVPITDENMAEHGWIRLPKDADGEYIHIGDVMEGTCPSGKHVNGTVNAIGDGVFWLSNVQFFLKPDYMHHHEPTVEDVLREFADAMNENLGMYTGEVIDADEWREADRKTIADFAVKLRLAGGDE